MPTMPGQLIPQPTPLTMDMDTEDEMPDLIPPPITNMSIVSNGINGAPANGHANGNGSYNNDHGNDNNRTNSTSSGGSSGSSSSRGYSSLINDSANGRLANGNGNGIIANGIRASGVNAANLNGNASDNRTPNGIPNSNGVRSAGNSGINVNSNDIRNGKKGGKSTKTRQRDTCVLGENTNVGRVLQIPPELKKPAGAARLLSADRAPKLKYVAPDPAAGGDDSLKKLPQLEGYKGYRSARGSHPVCNDSWYFECTVTKMDTPRGAGVRIGWSTRHLDYETPVGYSKYSFGLKDKTGEFVTGAQPVSYAVPRAERHTYRSAVVGDTIGCKIALPTTATTFNSAQRQTKMDNMQNDILTYKYINGGQGTLPEDMEFCFEGAYVEWFKNGKSLGVPQLFSENTQTSFPAGLYYPTVSLFKNASVAVNFGPDFKLELPEGARAYCERAEEVAEANARASANDVPAPIAPNGNAVPIGTTENNNMDVVIDGEGPVPMEKDKHASSSQPAAVADKQQSPTRTPARLPTSAPAPNKPRKSVSPPRKSVSPPNSAITKKKASRGGRFTSVPAPVAAAAVATNNINNNTSPPAAASDNGNMDVIPKARPTSRRKSRFSDGPSSIPSGNGSDKPQGRFSDMPPLVSQPAPVLLVSRPLPAPVPRSSPEDNLAMQMQMGLQGVQGVQVMPSFAQYQQYHQYPLPPQLPQRLPSVLPQFSHLRPQAAMALASTPIPQATPENNMNSADNFVINPNQHMHPGPGPGM